MKVKYLGDHLAFNLEDIPPGSEFSISLKDILKYNEYLTVEWEGNLYTVLTIYMIVIAPETLEDSLYLEELRKTVLEHQQILLGNCDTDVYLSPNTAEQLGRWLFENQSWNEWNFDFSIWHYMVSEIVKAEGIPYYEIIGYLRKDGITLGYQLLRYNDGKTEVLCDSIDIKVCTDMADKLMNWE